ncbi:hypothetical protein PFISCL1PPCAC_15033 [Pristionchus fissidentatus]|uniref:SP-RING-type domain-containing protein n=1 Tax=Pristionchus fissidentatus TaxID=1538716 RepID=A0AAV5VZ21_9BILA|nr:hypothetical protein PFISCL1PPCAC_15033 [Pristionchus fissidentatus]
MVRESISRETNTGQIRLALFDIRTRKQMSIPARSSNCNHTACFDLEPTLTYAAENGVYECPICMNTFSLNEIELDHFVASICRETYQKNPAPIEVMLDQSCVWQSIPREESISRFNSLPPSAPFPSYPPFPQMQHMQLQQLQQQQMLQPSVPSPIPFSSPMMQQQMQPLQQLQQMSRKRESGDTGGTQFKRFKSDSFMTAPTGSPVPHMMAAPHSVAPSMMMVVGPTTPMGSGMYANGGPPSAPSIHNSFPNMTSPFTAVHPSPMKEPSSHHSAVGASPMGMAMAPSTPYGMAAMNGGERGTTALTCATDAIATVGTSSAPYTPGSVDNKNNTMITTAPEGVGTLSNALIRAPSAALTPDTQASTSNASAEEETNQR